jgi:hypothetical protein
MDDGPTLLGHVTHVDAGPPMIYCLVLAYGPYHLHLLYRSGLVPAEKIPRRQANRRRYES